MMSAMAIEDPAEIARRFGRGVSFYRVDQGMSQKELSDRLREEGLTFDTAAISRVENGNRAVRLAEAIIIASVLNAPLEALVSGARETPIIEFTRASGVADHSLVELRRAFVNFANNELEVVRLLEKHPELVSQTRDDTVRRASDYLRWVAERRRSIEVWLQKDDDLNNGRYAFYASDEQRDGLIAIALASIETALIPRSRTQRSPGDGASADPAE